MRVVAGVVAIAATLSLSIGAQTPNGSPVVYRVSFPAPEHRFARVEVTFDTVSDPTLQVRMSRSSPGRYALHEFAKNVFDVHAFDGKGQELQIVRPNPYQWDVAGHDGTVRVVYSVYGDRVDGTYLGIDTTHAHMNLPATLMWARQFEGRPARITFVPPEGTNWKPPRSCFPPTRRGRSPRRTCSICSTVPPS
jgi:predicted metalloprotease with PDZ domain